MQSNKNNQRNEELKFLYEEDNNKKKKKRAGKKKSAPQEDNKFNFDNEIVIGVTVIPDKNQNKNPKKGQARQQNQVKQNKQTKRTRKINQPNKATKNNKKVPRNNTNKSRKKDIYNYDEEIPKRKSKIGKVITYVVLMGIFIIAMILFLLSPVFNVTTIEIENNNHISSDTYISLSGIQIGENTFKIIKNKVIQNIKQEPYVENVQVVRQLPDKIQIIVEERVPTLMIQYANSYVYINNQGYILEISEAALELPIIKSISTNEEEIVPGNRLNSEDLEKLNSVLKIIEAANGISIGNYITYIDIANKNDYIVRMDEKKKTIYLGDDSNLSNKLLYAKAIIEKEDGVEGNILANDAASKR